MLTESQNPRSAQLDTLPTLEILRVINEEDQTVALAVERALPQIARAVDAVVAALAASGRLFYVGAGASGRTGVIDAVECLPTYSVPPDVVQGVLAGGERAMMRSIEGAEDDAEQGERDLVERGLTAQDVVIGIAASGTTPYVLGALAYARALGCVTAGIACNAPAPVLDAADIPIALLTGPEVVAGSTRMKAGTAQKMTLNMISTASMVRLGKVYGNLMVDVQPTNQKLVERSLRIIEQITGVDRPTAQHLLEGSGRRVKLAIVMGKLGVSAEEGQRLLDAAGGHLRKVIG
ncbi:N-acetylmuramic acid 6-phosphate etherase [Aggregatilineales bacterium SYSU G02658]